MGINIVVDLRGSRDTERKIVTHLGMQYVAMPWRCSFPKDETFAQFLTQLGDNRQVPDVVVRMIGESCQSDVETPQFVTHGIGEILAQNSSSKGTSHLVTSLLVRNLK